MVTIFLGGTAHSDLAEPEMAHGGLVTSADQTGRVEASQRICAVLDASVRWTVFGFIYEVILQRRRL